MEIRRSVMARPNLSVSSIQHSALSIQQYRTSNPSKCRLWLNAECFCEKEIAGGKIPGSRLLSNAFFRKREAQVFPPTPLKDVCCGRARPHTIFLAAQAGYSRRPRRSETQFNYRCVPLNKGAKNHGGASGRLCSIAFLASGAITANPA